MSPHPFRALPQAPASVTMPKPLPVSPPRRSLLASMAALVAVPSVVQATPALASSSEANDAELIRLCAAHAALLAAVHTDTDDADDRPSWLAYEANCDAISDLTPTTLAGMQAKIRAAKVEAATPNGGEKFHNSYAGDWAWDVPNALLSLGAQA